MPISASTVTTPEQLRETIARKQLFPIYLFYGEETFLIDEITELLVGLVLNDSTRSFNFDVVDEADARDVASLVAAFPLESEKRVVIVKDLEKIEEMDLLIPLFEKPVETTLLIIRTAKPDFRTRIYRAIQHNGVAVRFRPLYENEIVAWICARVKKAGKEISAEVSELLVSCVGRSLRDIRNEIDKLTIFVGNRTIIDNDDINAVVGMSREYNIFELQKAIGRKDLTNALRISESLIGAGVSPIQIVSMLTRYFSNIWVIQEMTGSRILEGEMLKLLKLKDFQLRELRPASKLFSAQELENCFLSLLDADEALKTSQPPSVVLSLLVYAVIKGKSGSFPLLPATV